MSRLYSRSVGVMVMVAAAVAVASLASAQDRKEPPKKSDRHSDHSNHQGRKGGTEGSLAAQLAELRAKVAKLEAALAAGHPKPGATSTAGRGMKGMGKQGRGTGGMGMRGMGMRGMGMRGMGMGGMKGMGMQGRGMGGMKGMGMGGMKGMGMGGMGMGGMKGMGPAMGKTPSPELSTSSLPGFPGVSHLYHVGASGLFLDHSDHLQLSTKQKEALSRIRQRVLLDVATSERKISQAEQELWLLTAADKPVAAAIEAKIRAIASLQADMRLLQIRAVGEAAKLLTAEQRNRVTQEPNATSSAKESGPASRPAQSPR